MKMTIALILSFGILAGFFSNNQATQRNDLEEIKILADKNNIEVTAWMALSRGKVGQANDVHDMKNQIEQFMSNHDSYSWKTILEEENSHYVWQGNKTNEYGITESIKLKAYKSSGEYEIAITNEVKGSKLTKEQIQWVSETFEDSKTFYSLSGVMLSSNKLREVAAGIIEDAEAEAVEQLHEEKFISISAYSKAFESELMTAEQEKINLQIGLRANLESNEIDVTIGTPIITTEY
ncbi:YwmB family TATA-box binding protein [Bacillus sp. JJ1533]|uniref:YwmB family TATA-box binding protein n=1 Tax=Bacillales TaxID=1385 RepID=UPI002FFFAD5B